MLNKINIVTKVMRTFHTTPGKFKSHYDVLGITPKATQNDIKSAYYKLSKVYHPDKSNDEESARKFRAITEAYEVLGNIKLKKMYDKGLLVGQEYPAQPEPETDPTLKFYKSRNVRSVAPTIDGKTPIYDFDTWSKNHYGDLFNKSQYNKDLLSKRRSKQREDQLHSQQESIIYAMFAVTAIFIALIAYGRSDYDEDNISRPEKATSPIRNDGQASS